MRSKDAVNADQFTTAEVGESLIGAIYAGQRDAAVQLARRLAERAWEDGYRAARADQAHAASISRR